LVRRSVRARRGGRLRLTWLIRRGIASPGRVAFGFLGAEVGAAALASALAVVQLEEPATRCEQDLQALDYVLVITAFLPSMLAGGVLSAIAIDARRRGGALVWHLPAVPFAVVLALFVLGEALFVLTCIY
jgi:hypothetical protein